MAGMIEAVGTRKSEKGEMMQGNDKSRNLTKALVVCGVALALLGGSASAHAETPAALDVRPHSTFGAQATEVASGTWGTCPWVITSDGVLEIYAGEVSSSWSRLSPWSQYAGTVTSVKTVCASGERVVVSGDLSYLFADMEKVTSVDLSGWDTTAVTNMDSFFSNCAMLTSPSFAGWDFSQVADLEYLFSNCSSLDSLDLSTWNVNGARLTGMFSGCSQLQTLSLSGWDVSDTPSMTSMFSGCARLSSLDLSGWKVRNTFPRFSDCPALSAIDLSGWDTSRTTSLRSLFQYCSALTSINLAGWDTSSVESMDSMFWGCSSLRGLDLSGWDTSAVTSMTFMFYDCASLTNLNLTRWDTSNVTNTVGLFGNCAVLAALDLSSWDTGKVAYSSSMYDGCGKLTELRLGGRYVIGDVQMFPDATAQNGKWWSEADQAWYTKEEIVANRSGIADTYRDSSVASFSDVGPDVAHAADIAWLAQNGISEGWTMPDGSREFRPYAVVARADMAAFLFRLARRWGLVEEDWRPASRVAFADVTEGVAHAREIWWLAETGISAGWDMGGSRKEFRPYAAVARQDMAAFLFRLAKLANKGGASDEWTASQAARRKFRDVDAASPTNHHVEVWWLAETGVSGGWDVGGGQYEFRGLQAVARADMAAFLNRLDTLA